MERKKNVSKIYCEKCDAIYSSKDEYQKHFDKHSGNVTNEECPIDTVIQKFLKVFKREDP